MSDLRILYRNFGGFTPSIKREAFLLKLGRAASEGRPYDVVVIVETFWTDASLAKFTFPGYTAYHRSRQSADGQQQRGGVLILVRAATHLTHKRLNESVGSAPLEYLTIQVHSHHHGNTVVTNITGLYNPDRIFATAANLDQIHFAAGSDEFARSIICSDLNAHHEIWDQTGTHSTEQGENTLEWAASRGLTILNDPASSTRLSRKDGTRSSPDITFSKNIEDVTYRTDDEDIAHSDHKYITITREVRAHHGIPPKRAFWALQKANRAAFSSAADTNIRLAKMRKKGPLTYSVI